MVQQKKKDRTPEEVAAEFAGATSVMSSTTVVDDEPEPDYAKEAGLTTVGTVDDDEREIRALEAELRGADAPDPAPVAQSASIEPPAATLENIMKMMVHALQQIASGQSQSAQVAKEALDQAARQQQPDNKFAPQISDFNPQGDLQHPRPKLKCEMFLPWEAEPESLTYEEIELLNLLEEGEYVIRRNDRVPVQVKVRMIFNLNKKPQRLMMNSENQFTDDTHWMMPPLVDILRQILNSRPHTREAARNILTMDERIAQVDSGDLPVSVGIR